VGRATGDLGMMARAEGMEGDAADGSAARGGRSDGGVAHIQLRLFGAIDEADEAEVGRLLDAGASVDSFVDEDIAEEGLAFDSLTPLHAACRRGHVAIVTRLLGAGADVHRMDADGCTALHYVCDCQHVAVARLLIDAGADVDAADGAGSTPLNSACIYGSPPLVALLLEAGARVDGEDAEGYTPLHNTCIYSGRAVERIVGQLITAGAEVDRADRFGWSPLHIACAYGHAEVVAKLLAAGADVNREDADGSTPLHKTVEFGHLECAQLCSACGASRTFNIRGSVGTMVELAARAGLAHIAEWLARSREWTTRLHHLELLTEAQARAELRAGADVHAAARVGGPTPLSVALGHVLATGLDEAARGTAAACLVLRAGQPWCPTNHSLFPAPARARAVELVRIGFLLSRAPRFAGAGPQAVMDVWRAFVMPHAVERCQSGAGRADARQ